MVCQRSIGHGLEGFRTARAEVENPGYAVFPEPQVDRRHVAHVDEIALKAVAAFKQFRALAVIQLGVQMERHARHAAFVAFTRSVDIEVAEPDDLRVGFRQDLAHVFVEQEFGVAVNVQRLLVFARLNKVGGASAVSGGRRGVQERDFALQAVVQHFFGVLIVVIDHQNVGDALVVQRLNNVAADKSSAAGNNDHTYNLQKVGP